jgi:DNA-binding protein YbaB
MFGNLGKMMKVAANLKQRLPEVQAQLDSSEFAAEAGEGAVRATVNGKGRLLGVRIDRARFGNGNLDLAALEELITLAVGAAQQDAAAAAEEAMRELTGGMQLPGMEGML